MCLDGIFSMNYYISRDTAIKFLSSWRYLQPEVQERLTPPSISHEGNNETLSACILESSGAKKASYTQILKSTWKKIKFK